MRFGTVLSSDLVTWDTLKAAKTWAADASREEDPLHVVLVIEDTEGHMGVVSRIDVGGGKLEPQITIDGVENGTITTKINGKRVLILDPVNVDELDVLPCGRHDESTHAYTHPRGGHLHPDAPTRYPMPPPRPAATHAGHRGGAGYTVPHAAAHGEARRQGQRATRAGHTGRDGTYPGTGGGR